MIPLRLATEAPQALEARPQINIGRRRFLAGQEGSYRSHIMTELLKALRGSRIIAQGVEGGRKIIHYLLADGRVVEIVR